MEVSVLMPVFNGEAYLREAIESIFAQTYQNFELIVVNDGSTDKTAQILNTIQDPRLKVFHFKENLGVAEARNYGLKNANGEWIVLQDADDISFPTRIEEQINYLRCHPNFIGAGSLITCFSSDPSFDPSIIHGTENHFNSISTPETIRYMQFYGCPVLHSALTLSRKLMIQAGGYHNNYICEDFEFLMRYLRFGEIAVVPSKLYGYRLSNHSRSHSDMLNLVNDSMNISTKYIKENCFPDKPPRFLVIGSQNACSNFQRNIEQNHDFQVISYIDQHMNNSRNLALSRYLEGGIDGIIILGSYETDDLIQYFVANNLTVNKNLFFLYNIIS